MSGAAWRGSPRRKEKGHPLRLHCGESRPASKPAPRASATATYGFVNAELRSRHGDCVIQVDSGIAPMRRILLQRAEEDYHGGELQGQGTRKPARMWRIKPGKQGAKSLRRRPRSATRRVRRRSRARTGRRRRPIRPGTRLSKRETTPSRRLTSRPMIEQAVRTS